MDLILTEAAHLVSHGYGALGCAIAAAGDAAPGRIAHAHRTYLPERAASSRDRNGPTPGHCRPATRRPPIVERETRLNAIAHRGIPTIDYLGGHSAVLTAVAAAVARDAGGEHIELSGREHAVQTLGAPFNQRLERHVDAASRG